MKIFVDGDACPVKDSIIQIGIEHEITVVIVCSLSHYSSHKEGVQYIVVDNTPQAADMAIVNRVTSGDIVVTQDYGLAALVISKGCIALHHTGKRYTQENIEELLLKRYIAAKVRRGGGKTKGPKAFTKEDKNRFRESLLKVVCGLKQE